MTNTPWDERHAYIICEKDKEGKFGNLIADLEKKLHVSPFWGMDHQYEWLFTQPNSNLLVNMKNSDIMFSIQHVRTSQSRYSRANYRNLHKK